MKVLIALASSSAQLSGVSRHAINLARCLLTRTEITEVHLAFAPWQRDMVRDALPADEPRLRSHIAAIGGSPLARNLWFYSKLPRLAGELKVDVVHLAYPVAVNRAGLHCRVVVTLHDLYPFDVPENFGFPKVLFNRIVLRQCLRAVDGVACVSESTLARLREIEPELVLNKAELVYNCVERGNPVEARHSFDGPISPGCIDVSRKTPPAPTLKPFLLCVAQHRRNKNIPVVIRVFGRLLRGGTLPPEARLLIVGIDGPETPVIHRLIVDSGLSAHVLLRTGISDEQLQWCYQNCEVLLAPSSHEGFGLPVAEALLAGCRVVCSDIAAFREFGDSCRFVPLGGDVEKAFTDAVADSLLVARPAGIALPQLSAPTIAEKYLRLYRSLLPAIRHPRRSPVLSFPAKKERQHIQ